MNIQSAQMLQDSLQNLGNTFRNQRQQEIEAAYRNSQLDLERERNQTDQALREAQLQYAVNRGKSEDARADAAERRAAAADKRLDLANQPHIQAELKSDDGQQMTFTGTPDQLDAMLSAAKQQGKNITVSNKKSFAAQFNVGGAQFSFQDQDAAQKFADQMKTKGIDVYAQQPKGKVAPEDERNITIHHPATPDVPETPPVTHWFKPNEPGKPAVPGTPPWDEVLKTHVAPGQPMPTNAPFAMPPFTPDTNAPATVPPVTGLAPSMGSTALNTNGIPTGKPDPQDVQWLSQNPNPRRIATFEGKYGKGSASALLNPPTQQ